MEPQSSFVCAQNICKFASPNTIIQRANNGDHPIWAHPRKRLNHSRQNSQFFMQRRSIHSSFVRCSANIRKAIIFERASPTSRKPCPSRRGNTSWRATRTEQPPGHRPPPRRRTAGRRPPPPPCRVPGRERAQRAGQARAGLAGREKSVEVERGENERGEDAEENKRPPAIERVGGTGRR